jgi:hypothetical protein
MLVLKRSCCVLVAIALLLGACGEEDDDDAGARAGGSQLNEACQSTADCTRGLACLPMASGLALCRPVTASNVTPNDKECAAVQCATGQDCCENFARNPNCTFWASQCNQDRAANEDDCLRAEGPACVCANDDYTCQQNRCQQIECTTPKDCCARPNGWTKSSACATAKQLCDADPTTNAAQCTLAAGPDCVCSDTVNRFACTENRCVSNVTCDEDLDCTAMATTTRFCQEGRCVQCKEDAHCSSSTSKCVANLCQTPACKTNADCPAFSACQQDETTGVAACKVVGCQTDRECMTFEENYLAKCDTAAKPVPRCVIQCDRDAQCASSTNPLRKCVQGLCQDPGCDTDEECKIRLELVSQLPAGTRAVCRDRTNPAP